jgi:hypothetical protein
MEGVDMRRDVRLICCALSIGGLALASAVANAQTAEKAPAEKPDVSSHGDVPLNKKLDKNDGVLKPPHDIDPEIHQKPPETTGDKMPVIIPPGEPGGDQSVQPK